MSVPADRVEWTCPGCGKRFALPAHVREPKICPQCRNRSATSLDEAVAATYPLPSEPESIVFPGDVVLADVDISLPEFEPASIPLPNRRSMRTSPQTKYPALSTIVFCYRVLAGLVALAAIVGIGQSITATATADASPERTYNIIAGLGAFAVGLVVAVSLWAFGELIQLLLDIEENTRRASKPDDAP